MWSIGHTGLDLNHVTKNGTDIVVQDTQGKYEISNR